MAKTKKEIPKKKLTPREQMEEDEKRLANRLSILKNTFKIPPAINQFRTCMNDHDTSKMIDLFMHYKPETRAEKKKRLASENPRAGPKPILVKFGQKHVVNLIEQKKAKLVLIAADVDPIEHVVFLPTLCKKMGVPYAIVGQKALLGQLVNLKSATCVCLCEYSPTDSVAFKEAVTKANAIFGDCYETAMQTWGGGVARKLVDEIKE
ncbi:60S ribosomal protein L7a [Astathelohania contejeani]|uniref:60S ribosomal protein L8 n=1 Tax=Astathelohania contejeani TaxID=164912 RepID=A0ABQ7HXD7_9MICR|nr:60S ribosomal protein L7a [Thelohania contejeani]